MSKYIHLCIFQFIVFLFQNPRETAMTFESIVAAIDTALTGWVEFDNDFYFNELVESGGISCFYFYPLFIVARLTTAIADKEGFADQLTHAHQLEEDLAWFVDSLRHTPNQDVWKELLQQVRIQVQEAADEVKNEGYEAYPGNPEQMDHVSSEKAHVEGKAASKAEDNVQNEEDEPVIKRMRFSAKTEIGESSMKEDGSSEERVILVNDEDNEEPAIKKMCLSSGQPNSRVRDTAVKGTDGLGPALKRMKLSDTLQVSSYIHQFDNEHIRLDIRIFIKLSHKEPNTGTVRGDDDNNIDVTFTKEYEPGHDTKEVGFHTISTKIILQVLGKPSRHI